VTVRFATSVNWCPRAMSEKEMERIQQKIYLSRKSLNSIEFDHEVLRIPLKAGEETSFELLVSNRGEPTHVHLSLSKEIRDKLMLMQDKVYVIDDEKIAAIVRLPKSYAGMTDKSGLGEIFVSAGYGATKRSFSVEIVESRETGAQKEEEDKEGKLEEPTRTEKKELTLSADERELLLHVSVSVFAAILFSVFLVIMRVFSNSPGYLFFSALVASVIFIFIVIYNL
jgi:hypothetical protein